MSFRYMYGKPVKGTVTVTCLSVSYWTNKRNITTTMEVSVLLAVCSFVDFKSVSCFVGLICLGPSLSAEFNWHGLQSDLHREC